MSTPFSTSRWDELVSSVVAETGARLRAAAEAYAREEAGRLHQAVRRLRLAATEAEWAAALAEAAEAEARRAAVFAIDGGHFRLTAARGLEAAGPPGAEPLRSAPAFNEAAASREPVTALRAVSELGAPLHRWLVGRRDAQFAVFPVEAHGRVAALLYVDGGAEDGVRPPDAAPLELLADLAGAMLDRRAARSAGGLVNIGPGAARSTGWDDLPIEERRAHLRAQRAARVLAAEIRLYHEHAVQAGRRDRDLYRHLQTPIDAAREAFLREHMRDRPSMPDYFHLEFLRTLAQDDDTLAGPGYPGPLA